jgi:hypothetical protein
LPGEIGCVYCGEAETTEHLLFYLPHC